MWPEMPAEVIRLPTNRNTGTATSGNESSAYSVRCATRSSGRPLAKMYTRQGIAMASTTGKPSRNRARKAATTMKPSTSAALGQYRLFFFGSPAAPRVHEHHQRLHRQQQRPERERRHEQPERHLHDRRLVVEVPRDRHDGGDAQDAEHHDAAELDQELEEPARPGRQQELEFLHADLPALLGHVRGGEESEADEEVARHLLGAGHRHIEYAAHRDLRQGRDHDGGEQQEAYTSHCFSNESHLTARICSMYLPHSGKSLFTCASTAFLKPSTSRPSFCSTKIIPFASRSLRYFAEVSRSQSSVLRPTSAIVSSMILRSAAGIFW